MNPIELLSQPADTTFTPEEEALITDLLAEAYAIDEDAATNPEIQRLAEKVRQRIDADQKSQPGGSEILAP